MNGKARLILAVPLMLGLGSAWAQGSEEDEERYDLPGPAAQTARDASGVIDNDNAQTGLAVANEATMWIMDDAAANRPHEVTANIPLPANGDGDGDVDAAQGRSDTAGDDGIAAIEDAKAVAAEQALDALNAAQDAIEQRGRGNPPVDPPADLPPQLPPVPGDPGT